MPLVEHGALELCLKVETLELNRAEALFRQGFYMEAPPLPSHIGYEAAGSIGTPQYRDGMMMPKRRLVSF